VKALRSAWARVRKEVAEIQLPNRKQNGMQIIYLTVPIVVDEDLSERRIRNLARDCHNAFMVNVEPDDIGLVKLNDVPFDVPEPFGHVHRSDVNAGVVCNEGEHNCYSHCMDNIHVVDEELLG